MRPPARSVGATLLASALVFAACSGDDDSGDPADSVPPATVADADLETLPPQEIAEVLDAPPPGLVVLDVRTEQEFEEAHLDGATMLDFYADDFGEQLAALDRDTPYVVYCRSGNRSAQTLAMMRELGFTSVQESEGGIVAWVEAGLPVETG